MTITDAIVVISVFGAFGFLIWSSLVKKNHPIVDKVKAWLSTPKEKIQKLTEDEKWQQPNIEKRIY